MRHKIIIALLALVTSLSAQSDTLLFTYPFYFEDALGNRDTVLYSGSDTDSHLDNSINISGGSFDSVLDARVFLIGEYWNTPSDQLVPTYKHFVSTYEEVENCDLGNFVIIPEFAVSAQYWPVTITWDFGLFMPDGPFSCWPQMVLLDNFSQEVAQSWWLEPLGEMQFACMNFISSFTFDTDDASELQNAWGKLDFSIIDDETNEELFRVFQVSLYGLPTSCNEEPSATENILFNQSITLAPNPATSSIQLSVNDDAVIGPLDVTIYTVTGRIQAKLRNHQIGESIEVSSWPAGMYYLRGRTADGRMFTKKLVVN